RAVKDLRRWPHGNVAEADARSAGDAVEVVLLGGAGERIEEAALYLPLKLQGVFEVGALDDLVLEELGVVVAAALLVIAEAEQDVEERAAAPVALVVELVAVGRLVVGTGEEGRLPCGGVAVGSADRDDVAEVLGEGAEAEVVGDGVADVAELRLLLALAGDAVADEIVPVALRAVFRGEAGVEILIALPGGVGDVVEVVRTGQALRGDGVAEGEAKIGVAIEGVADIGGGSRGVEFVVGQRVRGVVTREGAEVVELAEGAAECGLVAVLVQCAGVAGVVEHGLECVTARRLDRDDTGPGVGAVDGGVGAAVDLDAFDGGGADGAVVKGAADVLGGNAVDEDKVCGGVAAAQEERGHAAPLAGLRKEYTGRLAE